jgi:hypothetical protein
VRFKCKNAVRAGRGEAEPAVHGEEAAVHFLGLSRPAPAS